MSVEKCECWCAGVQVQFPQVRSLWLDWGARRPLRSPPQHYQWEGEHFDQTKAWPFCTKYKYFLVVYWGVINVETKTWPLVEQKTIQKDCKKIYIYLQDFFLIPLFDRSTSSYGSGSSSLPPSPPSSLCTGRSSALYFRTHGFHMTHLLRQLHILHKSNYWFDYSEYFEWTLSIETIWFTITFFQGGDLLWTRNPCCNDSGTFPSKDKGIPIPNFDTIRFEKTNTKLRQASCGRMSRDKIEDLVCAPHLTYTQQVWPNIPLKSPLLYTADMSKIPLEIFPRSPIKVPTFTSAIFSDWGFLSASLDQQKCWRGNAHTREELQWQLWQWQWQVTMKELVEGLHQALRPAYTEAATLR